jgi:hypothetical protein
LSALNDGPKSPIKNKAFWQKKEKKLSKTQRLQPKSSHPTIVQWDLRLGALKKEKKTAIKALSLFLHPFNQDRTRLGISNLRYTRVLLRFQPTVKLASKVDILYCHQEQILLVSASALPGWTSTLL